MQWKFLLEYCVYGIKQFHLKDLILQTFSDFSFRKAKINCETEKLHYSIEMWGFFEVTWGFFGALFLTESL